MKTMSCESNSLIRPLPLALARPNLLGNTARAFHEQDLTDGLQGTLGQVPCADIFTVGLMLFVRSDILSDHTHESPCRYLE
jgi:hypothetical protein